MGERIVITGATGNIGPELCRALAVDNEVWAVARYSDPSSRDMIEATGARPVALDLTTLDFSSLPRRADCVIHLAARIGAGRDYALASAINSELPGSIMHHYDHARAFLFFSTASVYAEPRGPWDLLNEASPIGPFTHPVAPTYALSKYAGEAVVRATSRQLGLPAVIVRLNSAYGADGGIPAVHADWIRLGHPIPIGPAPITRSLIDIRDIALQVPAMLDAATCPATVVNWGGDEVLTMEQWCDFLGELVGRAPVYDRTGLFRSLAFDSTKRAQIAGPCTIDWHSGMRDMVLRRPAPSHVTQLIRELDE